MVVTNNGNRKKGIDMTDYKKELIEMQNGLCPITMQECEPADGDVIYIKGIDYFVSRLGLKFLRDRFGDKFIDERIIHDYFDGIPDDETYYPEY